MTKKDSSGAGAPDAQKRSNEKPAEQPPDARGGLIFGLVVFGLLAMAIVLSLLTS